MNTKFEKFLYNDNCAVSAIEFGFILPILFLLGVVSIDYVFVINDRLQIQHDIRQWNTLALKIPTSAIMEQYIVSEYSNNTLARSTFSSVTVTKKCTCPTEVFDSLNYNETNACVLNRCSSSPLNISYEIDANFNYSDNFITNLNPFSGSYNESLQIRVR